MEDKRTARICLSKDEYTALRQLVIAASNDPRLRELRWDDQVALAHASSHFNPDWETYWSQPEVLRDKC